MIRSQEKVSLQVHPPNSLLSTALGSPKPNLFIYIDHFQEACWVKNPTSLVVGGLKVCCEKHCEGMVQTRTSGHF